MASLRACIPYPVRVALVRVARWPGCARSWKGSARSHAAAEDYPVVLAEHRTPLRRGKKSDERLQQGKEKNLAIASSRINGVTIESGEVFSYHSLVGWPTRLRGFQKGLELRNGELSGGIGGGCCALSNLLYLIALRSGMAIVERHRHGLDFFPDHGRTVPFGCGATVFYPYADLKFSNPHPFPVLTEVTLSNQWLTGRIRAEVDPGATFEIEERDHQFRREGEGWYRENRIVRIRRSRDGTVLDEEEIAHNQGRCLYDPESSEGE